MILTVTSVQIAQKIVNLSIQRIKRYHQSIPNIDELEEKYSFTTKTKAEMADEMLPVKNENFIVGPDGYITNAITKELRKFAKNTSDKLGIPPYRVLSKDLRNQLTMESTDKL